METIQKLQRARVQILLRYSFFGHLLMGLPMRETTDIPTLATDGNVILFNPDFVESIPKDIRIFGILHEIAHIFLLHHTRRGNRNPNLWNEAGDYVINLLLKEEGLTLWEHCLYAEKFRGWSTEKVYDYLIQNPDQQQPKGNSDWDIGSVQDAKSADGTTPTQSERAEIEARIKARIQNAAAQARKAGALSAGLERFIDQLLIPKADWRSILQKFVTESAASDFDFTKANVRYLHQYGIVAPILHSESLGKGVWAVDTSGSMSVERDLKQVGGEIRAALSAYPDAESCVIYSDAKVCQVDEFIGGDDFVFRPFGGGGTQCKPNVDWVLDLQEPPAYFVYLTDGEVPDLDQLSRLSCPAMVVCTRGSSDLSGVPEGIPVINVS